MLERGYFKLGQFKGIPIRAHALTPVGALLFTGFRFEPGAWLGFLLLVLLHELGHAFFVTRYGLRVVSIDLHVMGGACQWTGVATSWQRAIIAWGGILAQLGALALTALALFVLGPPRSEFVADVAGVFLTTNVLIMALNLIPFPPFDGANAWKIVGELRKRY